jgi:hypothetical protein
MAFDDLQAEIGLLLTEMEGEQGDRHEIYLRIRQMLDTMKAEGLPLPQDLVDLEEALEAEFSSEMGDDSSGG